MLFPQIETTQLNMNALNQCDSLDAIADKDSIVSYAQTHNQITILYVHIIH